MDVVTGKPLSDILMLEQTLNFFSPKGITLTKFVLPLAFSLIAWLEERRKPILDLNEDLLCLVPHFGNYSLKGRKSTVSCNAVG